MHRNKPNITYLLKSQNLNDSRLVFAQSTEARS